MKKVYNGWLFNGELDKVFKWVDNCLVFDEDYCPMKTKKSLIALNPVNPGKTIKVKITIETV